MKYRFLFAHFFLFFPKYPMVYSQCKTSDIQVAIKCQLCTDLKSGWAHFGTGLNFIIWWKRNRIWSPSLYLYLQQVYIQECLENVEFFTERNKNSRTFFLILKVFGKFQVCYIFPTKLLCQYFKSNHQLIFRNYTSFHTQGKRQPFLAFATV